MRLLLTILVIIGLGALLAAPGGAQGKNYTAASCNESDVQSAISAEQVSPQDGDVIVIPAGTCTWTGTSVITQTFTNSVTIQGAGAQYATTGGAGTAGTDQTIIIDNVNYSGGPSSAFVFTTTAGKSFEWTGIFLEENSSSQVASNGMLNITGTSTAVRVDHSHFYLYLQTVALRFNGSVTGVADHDFFDALAGNLTNDIAFHNGTTWQGDTSGNADQSWVDTDHFGTSEFMFAEDDLFNNGDVGDAHDGARFVIRHCTMQNTVNNGQMYTHGLTDARGRATRAAEVYLNNWSEAQATGNPTYSFNSGALLYWGNTVNNYRGAVQMSYTRSSNQTYTYMAPPSGWGYCGTAQTGSPSAWDENLNNYGYACLDSPARGAGDLLSGNFPSVVDTRTGTITWPQQVLDPAYVWNNTYTNPYAGASIVTTGPMFTDNVDYYQQFGTYGEGGSFNGTKGVGQGLSNAKPSTCTAGPGGNTPGVGYWATDTNTLYVCNPTNTWTVYYTPYTYPNPLIGGVVASAGRIAGKH